jgi:hypothetical protein
MVRAENLALEYQSLRIPEMLPTYRQLVQIAHSIIHRAFSNEIITPGKTSTEDIVWWMRQELNALGLSTWFQPEVDAQRQGTSSGGVLSNGGPTIIERGDVLHCDFGIVGLRLNTDTQHMGYVLREGEKEPPEGIRRALGVTQRLQELVLERMRPGRSGNEVLSDALAAMKAEKIDGSIYCHPVGDHGHGAGPLIGLWDRQQGVPGRGDVLLLPNSWFAIELQATTLIPEWKNQPLQVPLEEDAVLGTDGRVSWVLQRQSEYHLIR